MNKIMMNFRFVFYVVTLTVFSSSVIAKESTTFNYDDWRVTCMKDESSESTFCAMNHSGVDAKSGRTIFQLGLKISADKKLVLEVLTPLGVILDEGLTVNIDNQPPIKMSYHFCINQGCLARKAINKKIESGFRRGNGGVIVITDFKGNKGNLPFSLKGFAKSVDKLYSKNK